MVFEWSIYYELSNLLTLAYDINATNRTLSNQWKYLLVTKHLPFAEARAPDEPDRHAEAEGRQVRPQALLRHGRN